jgi:hypothetical protein
MMWTECRECVVCTENPICVDDEWNHLSWRNDRATTFRSGYFGLTISTELLPERIESIVTAIRSAVTIPVWVKITGQSERVPDLAQSAFDAGADAVVMAGRLLGLIPDVDTFEPMLGTTLGVGGPWNLPLCVLKTSCRFYLVPESAKLAR